MNYEIRKARERTFGIPSVCNEALMVIWVQAEGRFLRDTSGTLWWISWIVRSGPTLSFTIQEVIPLQAAI